MARPAFRPAWPIRRIMWPTVVAVLFGAGSLGETSFAANSTRAQIGVGSPPVTGVTDGDVSTVPGVESSTTTPTGPVSVVGAATTIVAVNVGAPVGGVATPTGSTPASIGITSSVPDMATSSVIPEPTTSPATSSASSVKPGPTTVAPALTVDDLRSRISAALATSTSASMGIVVSIDGGSTVFERNADAPLIPASTQKIYIAGAALAALGVDTRFVTQVVTGGAIEGTTLRGDLIIRASGDPSFTSTNLNTLAAAVKTAGIANVTGALVVDDSRFDRQTRLPSWKAAFTPGESGWLSAFSVDGNHRNDAATVADPALANVARFRLALRTQGVSVAGPDQRGSAPAATTQLGVQRSAALQDLVRTFVKKSDNTYAELVTKELGAHQGLGSTGAGVAAIAQYFASLSLAPPAIQEDGSGLSSNNRSSARIQVRYLQKALAGPTGVALRSALAVSCVDGTLKSRTCGTAAAAKVFAKSGSIDNVVALTGVTTTASGKPITFSFLLNNVKSARLGRSAIDAALVSIVTSRV